MMTYNTGNAVPSTDPRDLYDNAQALDEAVNSTAATFTDRLGNARTTLYRAVELGMASVSVYPDHASGVAAVGEGGYFCVPAALDTEFLVLYRVEGGTYVEKKRLPSVGRIDEIQGQVGAAESNITALDGRMDTAESSITVLDGRLDEVEPAVSELDGRLDSAETNITSLDGRLDSAESGLAALDGRMDEAEEDISELSERTQSIAGVSSGFFPIVINNSGQVLLWAEAGLLNAKGVTSEFRDKILGFFADAIVHGDYAPELVPLVVTKSGQVPLWLENGRFKAVGLNETIQDVIDGIATANPINISDGAGLYAYRARVAAALGGVGKSRVIFTGDSWTEHLEETAQPLSQALYAAFGQSGQGWISVHADEGGASSTLSQLLNGARLIKSAGWSIYDMVSDRSESLDGHTVFATGTTATITITGLQTESLRWYYHDGTGTFRYSVDSGTPVVITGSNTGTRKYVDITGLSDGPHDIVFDLVGNASTVRFHGGLATRSAPGVEFSKAGNGGSTAVNWQGIAPYIQQYAAELLPDLVIVILGTNDRNQSITKTDFKAGIEALVGAYQAGSPHCGVLLVAPAGAGTATDLGLLANYTDAMREVAQSNNNVEFISLNNFMPTRSVMDSYGMWSDSLHLSESGGRYVTGLLMKHFLRSN
ncbi:SGNH/GDSL hydrolase family protein [Azotobacter chroococcum]|uniref:SGNH/GDSL hydrolase family protein n=1 Tax=Azotobacter chroococcum TaxID=353 RepID=UPI0010ADAA9D|nr:SGNH/GDSL hydrolase family protein [Azotobacter chroococcum]TKD32605.1 hypothetical protein FCG41_22005 [Azotobacter chroococcum]